MANAVLTEGRTAQSGGRAEYRLYLFAFYPLFLTAALVGRLIPKSRAPKRRSTVFHEAADMAHSIIPWVFSGR